MRFRDFRWPNDPETVTLERERALRDAAAPFGGPHWQDLGETARVAAGEGEFFGEGRWESYGELEREWARGGVGALSLPGLEPFLARLARLELVGTPEQGVLRYRFVFREESGGEAESGGARAVIAQEGESLWEIAARTGSGFEALLRENPQICWPNWLSAGEEVRLP